MMSGSRSKTTSSTDVRTAMRADLVEGDNDRLPGVALEGGRTIQADNGSIRKRSSIQSLLNYDTTSSSLVSSWPSMHRLEGSGTRQEAKDYESVLKSTTPSICTSEACNAPSRFPANGSGVEDERPFCRLEYSMPNIDYNGSIQIGADAILETDSSSSRQQKRRKQQQRQQQSALVPSHSLDHRVAPLRHSRVRKRSLASMQDIEGRETLQSAASGEPYVAHDVYDYRTSPYTPQFPYGSRSGLPPNGSTQSLERQGHTSRASPFAVPQNSQAYYDKLSPRRPYEEHNPAGSSGCQLSGDLGTDEANHSFRARGNVQSLRLQSRTFHPYATSSSSSTRPSPRRMTHSDSPTAGQASPRMPLKAELDPSRYSSKFSSRESLNQTTPTSSVPSGFELCCRQQPLHARMCGFGEKDRRPLDPPPIVQCFLLDSFGTRMTEPPRDPFLTVHATLWNEDGTDERNLIETSFSRKTSSEFVTEPEGRSTGDAKGKTRLSRVLMGSLVASPTLLDDENGVLGSFHIFPDLSIRTEGSYRLKFTLFSMNIADLMTPGSTSTLIGECVTDTFIVYSAKKFPGMHKSTHLTKALARQGFKIQVRNDARAKRRQDNESDPPDQTDLTTLYEDQQQQQHQSFQTQQHLGHPTPQFQYQTRYSQPAHYQDSLTGTQAANDPYFQYACYNYNQYAPRP